VRRSAGGKVASCLVKLASRYHKIAALAAFHSGKTGLKAAAEVSLSQLSARDAFPKAQLTRMRAQYARGEAVKRAGECRAYRIINPGTDAPELEVRLEENGPWVKYDGEVKSEDEIKREEEDEIKREEDDEEHEEDEEHVEDEKQVEDEEHVEDEGQTEYEVAILFRSYLL
jgi:hypothetical protein